MEIKLFSEPNKNYEGFKAFLLRRNPSEKFAIKYLTYLNSSLVQYKTKSIAGVVNIFEVNQISTIHEIYHAVKKDKTNIRLHNIYSGVISAYIKYLTGNELRESANKK